MSINENDFTEAKPEKRQGKVKVSIIIVTFNAVRHCRITLNSLSRTRGVDYEVVVVDNNSRWLTKLYLLWARFRGKINSLCLLDRNTLFAGGNNIGAGLVSPDATHFVLLNSDVRIMDPLWLRKLVDIHSSGVTSLGVVEDPVIPRADGYCFLIDRELYLKYGMDENYKWWWGITKLQAEVLRGGDSVTAVRSHDDLLIHYGGKSGTKHLKQDPDNFKVPDDAAAWFDGFHVKLLEKITDAEKITVPVDNSCGLRAETAGV